MTTNSDNSANNKPKPSLSFQARHQGGLSLVMGAIILISGIAIGAGGIMIYFTKVKPADAVSLLQDSDNSGEQNQSDQSNKNNQSTDAENIAKRAMQKAKSTTKRFARHYNFTKIQSEKVEQILEAHIRDALTRDLLHRRSIATDYNELHSNLKAVLTEKQYNQWARDFDRKMRRRFPRGWCPSRRRRPGKPSYFHKTLELIHIVDTNRDKEISENEIKRVQFYSVRKWLEKNDTNKDGKLSSKEISVILEKAKRKSEEFRNKRKKSDEFNHPDRQPRVDDFHDNQKTGPLHDKHENCRDEKPNDQPMYSDQNPAQNYKFHIRD